MRAISHASRQMNRPAAFRHRLLSFIEQLRRARHFPWALALAIFIAVAVSTRVILSAISLAKGQIEVSDLASIFGRGLLFDVVASLYLFAPFAVYLALMPARWYRAKLHRGFFLLTFAVVIFGLLYLAAVEYFFFDEFNARFNFVAVEYLIYPHEVFVNIWDSYPVARFLAAALLLTLLILYWVWRPLSANLRVEHAHQRRWLSVPALGVGLLIAHGAVNLNQARYSDNRVGAELALNGVYSFFSAAMNSHLDYPAYYLTLPRARIDVEMRRVLAESNATFLPHGPGIARKVTGRATPKNLHVVVLLQESLGAEFVGAYGDPRGMTPNLDRLAKESLLFTRAYATGTRTVRGMEAVSASFPPVPAESIVKRQHNEGLFNWSGVMTKLGYQPTFVYGGFGTFDNMNYFFANNGYQVFDRTDFDKPAFANIWGVSDEDLFRNAVRIFERQHDRGERIFSIVMSTSNHKPFTFPAGVPGVQEKGGGRDAGVRYADYAIGRFFDMAQSQPWFANTLFVIVADHGARAYGREDVPVPTYEIPLMIYSPKHVKPGKFEQLTSQIDIAPTVLGLLDASYDSLFFGRDVLREPSPGRFIPLNHNRDIALFNGDTLVEIGFRKSSAQFTYDRTSHQQCRVPVTPDYLNETIATFQKAYELFRDHAFVAAFE